MPLSFDVCLLYQVLLLAHIAQIAVSNDVSSNGGELVMIFDGLHSHVVMVN